MRVAVIKGICPAIRISDLNKVVQKGQELELAAELCRGSKDLASAVASGAVSVRYYEKCQEVRSNDITKAPKQSTLQVLSPLSRSSGLGLVPQRNVQQETILVPPEKVEYFGGDKIPKRKYRKKENVYEEKERGSGDETKSVEAAGTCSAEKSDFWQDS